MICSTKRPGESSIGVLYAIFAFGWWGTVTAIYFKWASFASPVEILAHRIVWGLPFLLLLLMLGNRWKDIIALLKNPATILILLITTLLIGTNWLVFIYSIASERMLEASLGYYINPILSIIMGMVYLKEKPQGFDWIAISLVIIGVTYLTWSQGSLPWISMVLAVTFGFYGLLRKQAKVDATLGLTFEMGAIFLPSLIYLIFYTRTGEAQFVHSGWLHSFGLAIAGPVTVLPLIWFTNATKRLRLSTIGFIQYIAPTGHFLCAVLLFNEPFTWDKAIAFTFIWIAVAIYSVGSAIRDRSSIITSVSGTADTLRG